MVHLKQDEVKLISEEVYTLKKRKNLARKDHFMFYQLL